MKDLITKIMTYIKILSKENIIKIIAISMCLFHLYTAGIRQYPAIQQRTAHLTFSLMLTFLFFPFKKSDKRKSLLLSILDFALVILAFFIGSYVFFGYENLSLRAISPNTLDVIVSVIAIILVMEATRRVMGYAMCIIIVVGFAYVVFGNYLPPMFAHSGYTFKRVVIHMFLSTEGILGVALSVSATVVIIFLIFGAFLEHSGASSVFTNIGYGLFGRFKGGAAKATVMGEYLLGMMTGSQTANVVAMGVVSIPLMIKSGYKPIIAGAIEALCATGSMLTPPVMGAAAFIIPEMIGGTYLDVMRAAVIPGFLFYAAIFTFIQIQVSKLGMQKLPKTELPSVRKLIKENFHLFIPILTILYLLTIERVSTKRAGFWGVIVLVAISMLRKNTRMTLNNITSALVSGPKVALIVAMACASAGLIEGVINLTGLGLRFSEILIHMAGGNVIYLLILAMFASLVIGLPLPPVTAYLILAILAAPALIKIGIHPMAAHLFILFFGVLGNITPPSAPVSFAAAGIAHTDPLKTTNLTFLISAPTYIIPYMVVFSNELMLKGSFFDIIFRIIVAFLAIITMSMSFQGFCLRKLNWILRIIMLIGSVLLIVHQFWANMMGILIMVIIIMWQKNLLKLMRNIIPKKG